MNNLVIPKTNSDLQLCKRIHRLNQLLFIRDKCRRRCQQGPTNEVWASNAGISLQELNALIKVGQEAQSKLFKRYLGLVCKIALQYPQADKDDSIQAGYQGLLKAANRYDPAKGQNFSSYAFWWVRDAIQVALKDNSIQSREHYTTSLNDELGGREIIESLVGEIPCSQEDIEQLRTHLSWLPSYDYRILELRFGLNNRQPKTLNEVAVIIGVSHETIRRHEKKAIENLKKYYRVSQRLCA